ncbi:hypothetical protein SERLA73DRAFT_175695 [Serpula lacrymans var. lacrymans S7.3]|uniref:Uncharacterized protein n=1 Tax=Serpula lacrymans var. lacrymans (strain S7.3) TaxID=936435 RepID=F8PL78_SERL3|nr:hypothetical protein SERLA73DRAFT_175695 [Serpula lacrymans var. lacrymans S7.3]
MDFGKRCEDRVDGSFQRIRSPHFYRARLHFAGSRYVFYLLKRLSFRTGQAAQFGCSQYELLQYAPSLRFCGVHSDWSCFGWSHLSLSISELLAYELIGCWRNVGRTSILEFTSWLASFTDRETRFRLLLSWYAPIFSNFSPLWRHEEHGFVVGLWRVGMSPIIFLHRLTAITFLLLLGYTSCVVQEHISYLLLYVIHTSIGP